MPDPGSLDRGRKRSASSVSSTQSNPSQLSVAHPWPLEDEDERDEAAEQDIEELWFPGCHADLGGGWPLSAGEESPLSHGPLVWMVREAQRAGLEFDREMMIQLKCCDDHSGGAGSTDSSIVRDSGVPEVHVTHASGPDIFHSPHHEHPNPGWAPGLEPEKPTPSHFHKALTLAATKGRLHDSLEFNNGASVASVLSWKIMECLPFRRMDLKPDGTWKAISFP